QSRLPGKQPLLRIITRPESSVTPANLRGGSTHHTAHRITTLTVVVARPSPPNPSRSPLGRLYTAPLTATMSVRAPLPQSTHLPLPPPAKVEHPVRHGTLTRLTLLV